MIKIVKKNKKNKQDLKPFGMIETITFELFSSLEIKKTAIGNDEDGYQNVKITI